VFILRTPSRRIGAVSHCTPGQIALRALFHNSPGTLFAEIRGDTQAEHGPQMLLNFIAPGRGGTDEGDFSPERMRAFLMACRRTIRSGQPVR
jgi:hypothetical protein